MPDASVLHVTTDHLAGDAAGSSLEERLERGEILVFPPGLLSLPSEDDLEFLRSELGSIMSFKNISYHPEGDYLSGIKRDPERRKRTQRILSEHREAVQELLGRALPNYVGGWRPCKVNFRPIQEKGRQLSRHSSNELLHVDAFASGATHGDRVLRFFTNIHPHEARVWRTGGLFPDLYREFGGEAGITGLGADGLRLGYSERAYSGLIEGLARAGLPQARVIDTSPYDRAMQRLHNFLKDNNAYQQDSSRWAQMEFPPFHSWVALTDTVSHAVVSGQHALASTYYVPLKCCARPDLAPYNIMLGDDAPPAAA